MHHFRMADHSCGHSLPPPLQLYAFPAANVPSRQAHVATYGGRQRLLHDRLMWTPDALTTVLGLGHRGLLPLPSPPRSECLDTCRHATRPRVQGLP